MQDNDWGASPDPDARLKGEILASLSTWTAENGLDRLDLAYTVTQMLLSHVRREQGLGIYIEFIERLTDILGSESSQLRQVIGEDCRRRAH